MDKVKQRSGQAMTEYILLLAILVSLFTALLSGLMNSGAFTALKKPLEKDFKFTYQYGHPDARGQNDGGPLNIPQKWEPRGESKNFRIFINPPINE